MVGSELGMKRLSKQKIAAIVAASLITAAAGYYIAARNGVCWTEACRIEQARVAEEAWSDVQRVIEQRTTIAQRLKQEIAEIGEARSQAAAAELEGARAATRAVPSNFFGNSWGQPLLQRIARAETDLNRVQFNSRKSLGPLEVGLAPFAVPEVVAKRPTTESSMKRLLAENALLKKAVLMALKNAEAADLLSQAVVKGYKRALDENQGDLSAELGDYNTAAAAAKGVRSSGGLSFIAALEPDDAKLILDLEDLSEPEVVTADAVGRRYEVSVVRTFGTTRGVD